MYFFRVSAGLYGFDNAQTGKWNNGFYLGATVNVIHAAELLGPLGISSKLEAKEE